MNIVILGAGTVGSYLAATLSQEEHNVILIDKNPKTLEKISKVADVATRLGSGTDWELLEDLMEQSPDLFIAMSSDDETNLIACMIAKNLGYPKTVARIRSDSYLDRERLDFSRLFFVDHFIGTELIVAHDILKAVLHPGNVAIETFAHGAIQMRTLIVPPDWQDSGKKLSEIYPSQNLLVGLIRRLSTHGKETLIFPRGHDVLLPGDEVTFIGESTAMKELNSLFHIKEKKVKSVVIVGGTPVALNLCRLLEEEAISVKIIEQDEEKCKKLSEYLDKTTILNQDGTDLNFLLAERVSQADVFVACTHSNETNILSASIAKLAGCEEVIALISDTTFAPLLKNLKIGYTLSEKVSITNRIHSLLHGGAVISVASLYENQAKILEVKVSASSEIVGIPIADLGRYLPQKFIIALIENRGRIMFARGSNILAPGDTVIVICDPKHVPELERIF